MNRRLAFLLLLLCLASVLPAGGRRERAPVVQATGRVRLVGNEPFSEVVITGEDLSWHIAKDEEHKLIGLQHRTVTVEGEETVVELRLANGRSAGVRRTLSNIRIIAIE